MLDHICFTSITKCLSDVDHCRAPNAVGSDSFGSVHVLCFGDLKQLPPATSQAPWVVLPILQSFDVRVLRQNRRVVQDVRRQPELDAFHDVLSDISFGRASNAVRSFIVDSYVRGAAVRRPENVDFEGSTAVFTKRRYRDRWNRTVVRRVSKKHNHSIRIKAKIRARGTRGQNWYPESRVQLVRKKCRTQSLFTLHLAGDWHYSVEDLPTGSRPHLMRCRGLPRRMDFRDVYALLFKIVALDLIPSPPNIHAYMYRSPTGLGGGERCMLIANLAVDNRFANGTTGRVYVLYICVCSFRNISSRSLATVAPWRHGEQATRCASLQPRPPGSVLQGVLPHEAGNASRDPFYGRGCAAGKSGRARRASLAAIVRCPGLRIDRPQDAGFVAKAPRDRLPGRSRQVEIIILA